MLQKGEFREKIVSVGVSPDSSESRRAPLRAATAGNGGEAWRSSVCPQEPPDAPLLGVKASAAVSTATPGAAAGPAPSSRPAGWRLDRRARLSMLRMTSLRLASVSSFREGWLFMTIMRVFRSTLETYATRVRFTSCVRHSERGALDGQRGGAPPASETAGGGGAGDHRRHQSVRESDAAGFWRCSAGGWCKRVPRGLGHPQAAATNLAVDGEEVGHGEGAEAVCHVQRAIEQGLRTAGREWERRERRQARQEARRRRGGRHDKASARGCGKHSEDRQCSMQHHSTAGAALRQAACI